MSKKSIKKPIKQVSIKSNRQLRDISFTLKNLLNTGHLGTAEILYEAGMAHAEHRAVLHAGAKQISHSGWSFTDAVEAVFPPSVMPAIQAGDQSGTIGKVIELIWEASKAQEEINSVLKKMITPIVVLVLGVITSLVFFLFLIPFMYEILATNVPKGYEPGLMISASVAANHWLSENKMTAVMIFGFAVLSMAAYLTKSENRATLVGLLIMSLTRIKRFGSAYANLKFGMMARYLEVVSSAGIEMSQRIKLVTPLIPAHMRGALLAFEKDMLAKGLKEAARSEGRQEGDPRLSPVLWPPYIRLAFNQSFETGEMDVAMNEYGKTMVVDGKERLELIIKFAERVSLVFVGLVITFPMGALYSTMGALLTLRLQTF